jgi:hypothetical protein
MSGKYNIVKIYKAVLNKSELLSAALNNTKQYWAKYI